MEHYMAKKWRASLRFWNIKRRYPDVKIKYEKNFDFYYYKEYLLQETWNGNMYYKKVYYKIEE